MNICANDKNLVLSVPLKTKIPYAISKGRVFQKAKTKGIWERYSLPFSVADVVTPKVVSEIIEWAINGIDAMPLDYDGKNVPV